jgi:uncharacterized protein (TIGR02172 family)
MNIVLSGRIDSSNAPDWEKKIREKLAGKEGEPLAVDTVLLEYISSAGLRLILRVKKKNPDLRLINVSPEIYEILDMTGFTEIIQVEKAYRVISVQGCEVVGHGANGTIYRIDQDNVVKVYDNADALQNILKERELAKLAFILGIPTAISYDVVRVGDSYGSVFEFLNARSFTRILIEEPDKLDWCVHEYVKMLRIIHTTLIPAGKLPDMKKTVLSWAGFLKDYLPTEAGEKLVSLVEEIHHDYHMIHGDYHTKNLVLQNDEVFLIDMDTLAVGHPIFELGSIFNAYSGFSEIDHTVIERFQGINLETGKKFWHKCLAAYLVTDSEDRIREVENKARIIGYTRLIRRAIRRNGMETEQGRKEIDHWRNELIQLLDETDTLVF